MATGGTATVVMSHRERALVFTAADLRVLPSSESYELWLMGPAGNRPAGMINVSGRGKMARPHGGVRALGRRQRRADGEGQAGHRSRARARSW